MIKAVVEHYWSSSPKSNWERPRQNIMQIASRLPKISGSWINSVQQSSSPFISTQGEQALSLRSSPK